MVLKEIQDEKADLDKIRELANKILSAESKLIIAISAKSILNELKNDPELKGFPTMSFPQGKYL